MSDHFAGTIEERCCIHGYHWESAWPDANALNTLHGIMPMASTQHDITSML